MPLVLQTKWDMGENDEILGKTGLKLLIQAKNRGV